MYPKYFKNFPPGSSSDLRSRIDANLTENLGADSLSDPNNAGSRQILGSLASHDLSAMREVLGMPRRVLCSTRSAYGKGQVRPVWWTVLFDYGTFKCTYEMGIDEVIIFDAQIEVYTTDQRVKIQYDTWVDAQAEGGTAAEPQAICQRPSDHTHHLYHAIQRRRLDHSHSANIRRSLHSPAEGAARGDRRWETVQDDSDGRATGHGIEQDDHGRVGRSVTLRGWMGDRSR